MSSINSYQLLNANATNTSTWDTVKNSTVSAANWVVRQAKWVGNSLADFMLKIYEFVKPVFVAVGKFFTNSYHAILEFFKENRNLSIGILVTLALAVVAATVLGNLCGGCVNNAEPAKP